MNQTIETPGTIRVRFAPSPTGFMHIGSLRTALYNYLFAHKHGGDFIVRIDDTDQKRFVTGAVENLIKVLHEFGLEYDEGPLLKANFQFPISNFQKNVNTVNTFESIRYPGIIERGEQGPYIQSERLEFYRDFAQLLVSEGKAYYCFCTVERLETMRKDQQAKHTMPKYDRHCLTLSREEIQEKMATRVPHVIRFKIPDDQEVAFTDLIREEVTFKTETIDDQVLLKSDGFPTYHLACVVDDHLMEITHVIRSEEWLPSTPKHILLYQAFNWTQPAFGHIPLLLNPDRSKLSKRKGDMAVETYLRQGYLKEALLNFVALLGWNPGKGNTQEIFSLEELIERFDLAHVHKGGAVFDVQKLDWLNAQYIKRLSIDDLLAASQEYWRQNTSYQNAPASRTTPEYLKRVLTVEQERLTRLDQVGEQHPYFFSDPDYSVELLHWKNNGPEVTREALRKAQTILEDLPEGEWTREQLEQYLLEAAGDKKGDFLWPLRVALSGAKQSPPPGDLAWVVGKEASRQRIVTALTKLPA